MKQKADRRAWDSDPALHESGSVRRVDTARHGAVGLTYASRHAPRGSAVASPKVRGRLKVVTTINREKPPLEVHVIVWVGLAILLAAVGAFVWPFVLGHGFKFSF